MPDMAQPDFDELGGYRMIAREFGGSASGIMTHIRNLTDQLRGLPTADQTIVTKTDADALRAYRALGTIEEIQAKFVKEGNVVVPKTDADELALYRALGKPDEVKTKLEKGDKDAAALALAETRTSATSFVKAAGLADTAVDALISMPQLAGAKFEVRTAKVDDGKGGQKDQPTAYLTLAGEGQTAMKFSDAEEKVPALKGLARASTNASADTNNGGAGASWGGTGGTGSSGAGGTGGKTMIDSILEQMNKNSSAPNALSPVAAATA